MKWVTAEFGGLKEILRRLEDISIKNPANSAISALSSPNGQLKQCGTLLEGLNHSLERAADGRGLKKIAGKIAWPFQGKEMRETLVKLKQYKPAFSLATTLDTQ